jgi:hypothetical protein
MVTLVRDHGDTRVLRAAAIFFGLAVLIHNADHLRRGGDSVSTEVFWVGSSALVLETVVVALVLMRHRAAAIAATVIGLSLAFGYISVHFTPERGFFSDSLLGVDASSVSIAAAFLETASAFLLGIAGARVLRQEGIDLRPDSAALPWRDALRHPLVIALIAGNALVFIGSLATR